MPAMLKEITYIDLYGNEVVLRHPIPFDAYPRHIETWVGGIILSSLDPKFNCRSGLHHVISLLKKHRHAMAYNAKVIKAVRRRVTEMPFYVDGRYYSPFDLCEAQSAIQSVLNEHTKMANRLDLLIKDFQERLRLRKIFIKGTQSRMHFDVEDFLMERF